MVTAPVWTSPFHQGGAGWDSPVAWPSITVVFKIIRGVGGGTGSGSLTTLFRRSGFPVRLASEVTIASKENAKTSGQTKVAGLLLFFKQTLPAGEQAVDSIPF